MRDPRFSLFLLLLVFCASCHGGTNIDKNNIPGKPEQTPTETLQSLINSLENKNDRALRNSIKSLRLMKSYAEPAVPKLLEIISDQHSTKIQMEAMLAVAQIAPGEKKVIDTLLLKLGHPDEEVRKKALEALNNTGTSDPIYIKAVESMGKEDPSRMVRKAARRYYNSIKMQKMLESSH